MQRIKELRPVWAEINLDNLAHNMREVKRIVKPGTILTAVVKADGYGHGAVHIGETLIENGADRFAVATLSEAIQLRRKYPEIPILVLGYTPVYSGEEVIKHDILQTVYTFDQAYGLSKIAQEMEKEVKLHIKVDTGMRRLGFEADEATVETIERICSLPNVVVEGIYTHFAVADELDKTFTQEQVRKFKYICDNLDKRGINIPIKHVSNSAGIIDMPDYNFNMVRAGIMLYGLYPSKDVKRDNVELKEVMSLKARVSHVKELDEGVGVSYGLIYRTPKKSKIATLPLGYADGFTRMLTGKAQAIADGNIVPIVGRICMDQCMLDVTNLDINRGDEVILFGSDGNIRISIDDVAAKLGTINYEIVCMIGKRVPRVYIKNGEIVNIHDYILNS